MVRDLMAKQVAKPSFLIVPFLITQANKELETDLLLYSLLFSVQL